MTDLEKAKWLRKNYREYALDWYLSDHARLNAIFKKQYQKYLSALNAQLVEQQQAELNEIEERMRCVYRDYYGTDYLSDSRIDRRGTFERVREIRHLWSPAPAH